MVSDVLLLCENLVEMAGCFDGSLENSNKRCHGLRRLPANTRCADLSQVDDLSAVFVKLAGDGDEVEDRVILVLLWLDDLQAPRRGLDELVSVLLCDDLDVRRDVFSLIDGVCLLDSKATGELCRRPSPPPS